MHIRQVGFGQALEWLEHRFGILHRCRACDDAPNAGFGRCPARTPSNWPRVERYLIQERKLPATLLEPLGRSGNALRRRPGQCGVPPTGHRLQLPVGAELRGTTDCPWRGMAPGSRKDRGFFSVAAPAGHAIVLCESAIDALSCHALHPDYRCLSTSGARPDPAWLPALIAQGLPIYCGFDADPTGDAMAQRMHQLHPSIRRLRPAAKDWNDLLRQLAR